MDELEKGLEASIQGEAQAAILARVRRQLEAWQLSMPAVEPLVWDFGLGDFERVGLVEYWIANEAEAGYCGKYLFVFSEQTCPQHRHQRKHETFFIVKGRVRMVFDGAPREMGEGDVLPIPPTKPHSFTGIGPALLLEVSQPCKIDDNFFDNTRIPIGGNRDPGTAP